MNAKQLVKRAELIRVREHRLRPSIRLRTKRDIYGFIQDEEIVSVLGGNELPSLISAVLGTQWRPSKRGFSGWLDWWSIKISGHRIAEVFRELEGEDDILSCRLFRRTKTFVSRKMWPLLDPIVRHYQEPSLQREILSDLERRILKTITSEGAIRTDRLRRKLDLEGREKNSRFHRALSRLESYSLIIGVEDSKPEKHLHANIWQTWERRTGKKREHVSLSYQEALNRLFQRTIDACVLTRADEIRNWFSWRSDIEAVSQEILRSGDVLQAGPYLVSSRVLN